MDEYPPENEAARLAVKLERKAAALVMIAAVLLIAGAGFCAVGVYQLIATDEPLPRFIAGGCIAALALLPFGIAQIYFLRSHLLRIEDQLRMARN